MSRSHLPLNGLRAFEVFARHGRMTLAAAELCVTHGAVSRQIKGLEAALGVSLTEGPRNGLRLSEAGRRLAAALTPLFDDLEAALPRREPEGEVLQLACVGTLASKWLIPRLPAFLDHRPGASVRIIDANGPTAEITCALQLGHDAPADAAEIVPFLNRHHAPVVAAAAGRDLSPDEVLRMPRLISRTYPGEWEHWAQAAGVKLPAPTGVIEFARYLQAIGGAAAGLGAAIGSWFAVKAEIESGALLAPFGFVQALTPCVFVRAHATPDPLAEAFRDWVVAEGASGPLPPGVRPRR